MAENSYLDEGSPFLRRTGIICLGFVLSTALFGQRPLETEAIHAWADSMYRSFADPTTNLQGTELGALDSIGRSFRIRMDTCRLAHVQAWRSNCFDKLGQLDSAMASVQRAQSWFRPRCDSLIWMSIQVHLSNVLMSVGDNDRMLRVCDEALALWNDAWRVSNARDGLLTNRAIALAMTGDLERSMMAFKDVLRNAEKEGNRKHEITAFGNIGTLYGMMSEDGKNLAYLDSTEHYLYRTLDTYRSMGNDDDVLIQYVNIASLAKERGRYRKALLYLDSAAVIANAQKNLGLAVTISDVRRMCFLELGNLDSAYYYLNAHVTLKDSLLNTEKVKAIADVQEKYESEKKARTIKELEVINLDGELRKAQLTRTRNIYLFSGIGVLLVAGALWSRLRYVHRSRAAIRKEKEISEGLLHNILPEEVATELRLKGYADAQEFEKATILFTDFKGFTSISEQLTAAELVEELNTCFKAFDGIMEKYTIEKIKTIGDAYMAAGGLPDTRHGSPVEVVTAALEMQAFMATYKADRIAQGKPAFEMRVGIHTGPVVAGIVGVKKFAYDIWGDTVNTASRMESSGETGKVNISEATYDLVIQAPGFVFTPRGKIQAKGKGELEMYFVEQAA